MKQSPYFESKVLTATPQRLHLTLIEGAIRFGRQAQEALKCGEPVAAAGALLRMVDIVGELLAGVRHGTSPVNRSLSDLYWFLFRRVAEAKINSDSVALAEALRLLEYERQTWQLVCDKFGGAAAAGPPAPLSRTFDSNNLHEPQTGVSWQV
ncbi:MAG TPA: flagellar export chaperone FliS [Lacipirellulaceae bacterium]|nr:flagellar export chaperone FliS [Lacipirellulaceae bacterium]